MDLAIAHLVADTQAEGPGRRFAIWVQGCSIRCEGCCNPEFFGFSGGTKIPPAALAQQVFDTPDIEGVSLLGGEPFDQAQALLPLVERVTEAGLSVMIYSGYTLAELTERSSPEINRILARTDLLVDGPYDQTKPETQRRWLGSTNQQLHFLTVRYSPLEPCFWSDNTIEIRFDGESIQVNGWPIATEFSATS
jgi:anaerobic ribonucleoside-triphosphate reductase activating protein